MLCLLVALADLNCSVRGRLVHFKVTPCGQCQHLPTHEHMNIKIFNQRGVGCFSLSADQGLIMDKLKSHCVLHERGNSGYTSAKDTAAWCRLHLLSREWKLTLEGLPG